MNTAKLVQMFKAPETDWPELVKEYVEDPNLIDKLGSSDLKRVSKMMARVVMHVSHRTARAELQAKALQKELAEAPKADDATLQADLKRALARNLILTGGRPAAWSYLYKEACELLHVYVDFEAKRGSKGWTVFGVDAEGQLHKLYDYDYAGLGVSQAAAEARLTAAHLRQSFNPRSPKE